MTEITAVAICRTLREARATQFAAPLILALFAPSVDADVPTTLRYQARVVGSDGQPVEATLDVVFRIYDDPTGGVLLYDEFHTTVGGDPGLGPVTVSQGLLAVEIGAGDPLPPSLLDGVGDVYLGVTLGADSELTPRLRVSSAPYSLRSSAADDVPGKDITPNSITVNTQPVVDATGAWVGDPTGLAGPTGPPGPTGETGPAGTALGTMEIFEGTLLAQTGTSSTWTPIPDCSVSVTVPPGECGEILLIGTVDLELMDDALVRVGIADAPGSTAPPSHSQASLEPGTSQGSIERFPMVVQDARFLSAGSHTFFLKQMHQPSTSATINQAKLTGTYLPMECPGEDSRGH